jgi:hypothetical protein
MTVLRAAKNSSRQQRWRAALPLGASLLVAVLAAGSTAVPPTGSLRIVWEQDLPPYPSGPAMDIRWASDGSVFLAWIKEGVTETALDGNFTRLRTLVADPGRWMRDFEILATSKEFVVASARFRTMTFRPTASGESSPAAIANLHAGIVEDLDLAGSKLLLLGNPAWSASSVPSILWTGPLTEHPASDLKPLPLYDLGGAESPGLVNCDELLLGAVRFLPDGSFLVVPGFQPAAHHFSAGGRLLRTWDTQALGLDALDCAHLSAEQHRLFGRSPSARFAFLNQHRVLDEILPLADGPGLVLRWVAGGKVHWEVKVLQSGARVLTYQVPFTGEVPYDRLRGDVRGNRIVLLRAAHGFDTWGPPFRASHVVVAELPGVSKQRGGS